MSAQTRFDAKTLQVGDVLFYSRCGSGRRVLFVHEEGVLAKFDSLTPDFLGFYVPAVWTDVTRVSRPNPKGGWYQIYPPPESEWRPEPGEVVQWDCGAPYNGHGPVEVVEILRSDSIFVRCVSCGSKFTTGSELCKPYVAPVDEIAAIIEKPRLGAWPNREAAKGICADYFLIPKAKETP